MAKKDEVTTTDSWQVKQDLQALMDAQTIKDDPKRYAAAMKLFDKQFSAMKAVKAEHTDDQAEDDE